jgi:hypothetical protein
MLLVKTVLAGKYISKPWCMCANQLRQAAFIN